MTPFLKYVANDLCAREGKNLGRVAVVFPNKRAGLFFDEYLREGMAEVGDVQWKPRYMTISELFGELSPLRVADTIETVCRIHRLYVAALKSDETLDVFYGWGEKLLSDFDDVDKNMADARRLFRTLAEIKELDKNDYLDKEKEELLQHFFRDFRPGSQQDSVRTRFVKLWDVLYNIYEGLNEELAAEGLAYEGALYRRVVESLMRGECTLPNNIDKYAFVGFNVLNKVETQLFTHLQDNDKALFYWDYDKFYCPEPTGRTAAKPVFEAGTFLSSNLVLFPNALPPECFDNFSKPKDIEFVSAATENAQARSAQEWLKQHPTPDNKEVAIVLCNENLLQPLLHALPEDGDAPNITKGFPLHHTVAYRTVERVMNRRKRHKDNVQWLEELQQTVHTEAQTLNAAPESLDRTLNTEAYFEIYKTLGRFRELAATWLNVEPHTLLKLLRQVFRSMSVPFHGEPLSGIQVLGVLETRCLDFRNILMLSVNEGNIPRRVAEDSFIPYPLRCEFGLTTSRHKIAVYAYYFYRLIQRAEHVRMVYNASTGNNKAGEMSRFMTQLLVSSGHPVRHLVQTLPQSAPSSTPRAVRKPKDLAERLATLSPSAINTYLRCPVQFFYQRVMRLDVPQEEDGIIAPNKLGSVFHKAAQLLYTDLMQQKEGFINAAMLADVLAGKNLNGLDHYVKRAIVEEEAPNHPLVLSTVKKYLKLLLLRDKELGSFKLIEMEQKHGINIEVPTSDGVVPIRIEGYIDRIDEVASANGQGTTLRILDYKTGGQPEKANSVEQLFKPSPSHPHYILQTFIYSLIMAEERKDVPIKPALFFVHKAANEGYSPGIRFNKAELENFRVEGIIDKFHADLVGLLQEILDLQTDFQPTTTDRHCETCAFATLCKY